MQGGAAIALGHQQPRWASAATSESLGAWTFSTMSFLPCYRAHVPAGTAVQTLGRGQPNWVAELGASGVRIETERSRALGGEAQLVPAWMLQSAWSHLNEHGRLTNKHLLATDGLNVKRSSAVCALLSQLPGVEVESRRPIVLRLRRRD